MGTNENLLNSDLQVDETSYLHLKESAMWAKLVSVVGIVMSILLAIVPFFIGSFMAKYSSNPYSRYNSSAATIGAGFITVVYLIMAIVLFLISLFLYRFAVKLKTALQSYDQGNLNLAFQNLKVYFRILGIITIIYIVIIVLAMLGTMAAGIMR